MKKKILKYIVCIDCQKELQLRKEKFADDEIWEGKLICSSCNKTYDIKQGIPILLSSDIEKDQSQVQDSFAKKWVRSQNYGYTGESKKFSIDWFFRRYPWYTKEIIKEEFSHYNYILDAGTGLGYNALWMAKKTIGEVFAVDISSAIFHAYHRYKKIPNAHLIQADLTRLPFKKNFFDYILSDGVLHHTPNTKNSFLYLSDFLQKPGIFEIYIYKKKVPIREFCDDYIRKYTTEISSEECFKISEKITRIGRELQKQKITFVIPEDIPILNIKAGEYDLQDFIYWNIFKCFWNDSLSFNDNVIVNFDWYHPKYAHRHTEEEVQTWCKEKNGLVIEKVNSIQSGMNFRIKKQ